MGETGIDFTADIQVAREWVAEYESMHNGEVREQMGEAWYGSPAMRSLDENIRYEMGILLPWVMQAYAALEAQNATLRERVTELELYVASLERLITVMEPIVTAAGDAAALGDGDGGEGSEGA